MEFMNLWIDLGWTFIKFVAVTTGSISIVLFSVLVLIAFFRSIFDVMKGRKKKASVTDIKSFVKGVH